MSYKLVGKRVADRRGELDLTLEEVVKELHKSRIKISVSALSALENGQSGRLRWGDPVFVRTLAKVLHLVPKELLEWSGHLDVEDKPMDHQVEYFSHLLMELDPEQRSAVGDLIQSLAKKKLHKP